MWNNFPRRKASAGHISESHKALEFSIRREKCGGGR